MFCLNLQANCNKDKSKESFAKFKKFLLQSVKELAESAQACTEPGMSSFPVWWINLCHEVQVFSRTKMSFSLATYYHNSLSLHRMILENDIRGKASP